MVKISICDNHRYFISRIQLGNLPRQISEKWSGHPLTEVKRLFDPPDYEAAFLGPSEAFNGPRLNCLYHLLRKSCYAAEYLHRINVIWS